MKIPDSVRIGGVEYHVHYVENLLLGSDIAYGRIDFENCRIDLSSTDGVAHEKRCLILWHEILHGICAHAGLEIKNEEAVVEMFAKGIYQVLQDNGGRLFDLKEVTSDANTDAEPRGPELG